jgi:ABC-type xylose transport system substrate-binding protein
MVATAENCESLLTTATACRVKATVGANDCTVTHAVAAIEATMADFENFIVTEFETSSSSLQCLRCLVNL